MATRLLLLADTHVPKRARDLPAEVWTEIEARQRRALFEAEEDR